MTTTFNHTYLNEDTNEETTVSTDYEQVSDILDVLEENGFSGDLPVMYNDPSVYNAFAEVDSYPTDMGELEDLISRADEAYFGEFGSWGTFAETLAEELYEVPTHWPFNCISWDSAGEDLKHDYSENEGHYFRDN